MTKMYSRGYNIGWLVVNLFVFEIIIFCFVVDICDLVHDVEVIFHLP